MNDDTATLQQASLVILSSDTGRGPWEPVLPAEVPEWVKAPDNIAKMMQGEACMKCDEGERGSLWYAALPFADYERLMKAQAKRERRRRRLH